MAIYGEYEERVQARINSIYELMEHHEAHLESTESTSMESHLDALKQLKAKRAHLDGLLQEIKVVGEHGWQNLRKKIDPAIDELKHAVDLARAKLHGEK